MNMALLIFDRTYCSICGVKLTSEVSDNNLCKVFCAKERYKCFDNYFEFSHSDKKISYGLICINNITAEYYKDKLFIYLNLFDFKNKNN